MTIKKSAETGGWCAQCDNCLDVVDLDDAEDFYDAKRDIDADGWRTKRAGDKWQNICPDCQ